MAQPISRKLALTASLLAVATAAQGFYQQAQDAQAQQLAQTGQPEVDQLQAEKQQKWAGLLEQLGDEAMASADRLSTAINRDDPAAATQPAGTPAGTPPITVIPPPPNPNATPAPV